MTWLNSIFGGSTAANLIAITVGLVLVLLGLFWVFRKIAGSNSIRGTKNRRPRLGVTEAAIVDDKRRLVLVRRDNVEHLVLIGGASDVLVERNIVRVQPATSTVEPIRTKIAPQEPDEDEGRADLERTDTLDDARPSGVSALASGAAATAAVVASIENALSKADDAPEDDVDDSEFTAAVANTLANGATTDTTNASGSIVEDTKVPPPGLHADEIVEAELEAVEAVEAMSETLEHSADVNSDTIDPTEYVPPVADEAPEPEPQDAQQNDEPSEPEDVEIKLESISESDDVLEETLLETPQEEVKTPEAPMVEAVAPEVVPPFEVAAEISHKDTPTQPADKTKDTRHDDMEDEMQKLLSELAGERRG
ncbi:MAG: flagellar biosynthetic protein FliO [Rhizobiaceae bacterium]